MNIPAIAIIIARFIRDPLMDSFGGILIYRHYWFVIKVNMPIGQF